MSGIELKIGEEVEYQGHRMVVVKGVCLRSQAGHTFVANSDEVKPIPRAPVWPESVTLGLTACGDVVTQPYKTIVDKRTISLATPSLEDMGKAGVVVVGCKEGQAWWWRETYDKSKVFDTYEAALADARRYCKEKLLCDSAVARHEKGGG